MAGDAAAELVHVAHRALYPPDPLLQSGHRGSHLRRRPRLRPIFFGAESSQPQLRRFRRRVGGTAGGLLSRGRAAVGTVAEEVHAARSGFGRFFQLGRSAHTHSVGRKIT